MLSKVIFCDDDLDNVFLFLEAAEELPQPITVKVAENGKALMEKLKLYKDTELPQIVFLDLNIHGKTGVECLMDIVKNKNLQNLSVVIMSTNYDQKTVDYLYDIGASYFMEKSNSFNTFKKRIQTAIELVSDNKIHPVKEEFVLS